LNQNIIKDPNEEKAILFDPDAQDEEDQ